MVIPCLCSFSARIRGEIVRVLYRPPYSSYSNPILYEKGFGYVFCLQEVLRKGYSAHKPECERMRR